MSSEIRIGLVGDYDPSVVAHQAIPIALQLVAEELAHKVLQEWVPTEEIRDVAQLTELDGLWCVPASPYRSMDGALRAIRFAREQARPFLGTCGGFQHAVVEYARNVLAWSDADHGETAPDAFRQVISPLSCALVEVGDVVRFRPGSRIFAAYGCAEATEGYHCSYGLNPEFRAQLTSGPLKATAEDVSGEIRAIELDEHPFFIATLFQPERAALQGKIPPLVRAFVRSIRSLSAHS